MKELYEEIKADFKKHGSVGIICLALYACIMVLLCMDAISKTTNQFIGTFLIFGIVFVVLMLTRSATILMDRHIERLKFDIPPLTPKEICQKSGVMLSILKDTHPNFFQQFSFHDDSMKTVGFVLYCSADYTKPSNNSKHVEIIKLLNELNDEDKSLPEEKVSVKS